MISVMSDGEKEAVDSTKSFVEKMLTLSNLPSPSTEKKKEISKMKQQQNKVESSATVSAE